MGSIYSWDVKDTVDTLDFLESGRRYYFAVYVIDWPGPHMLSSPKSNVVSQKTKGWEFVADTFISSNLGSHPDIAVYDSTNIYVASVQAVSSGKATVYKYNGNNWSPFGQSQFSPDNAHQIKIDLIGNVPYVAFLP